MIRKAITVLMLAAMAVTSHAENILDGWDYYARLGYNIGGTAPVGMPATIRSMNDYRLMAKLLPWTGCLKAFERKLGRAYRFAS